MRKEVMNFVFPPRCIFCRELRAPDAPEVCPACGDVLPRTPPDRLALVDGAYCAAPFYYEGVVRDAMRRFKFNGIHRLARPLSAYLADAAERLPRGSWTCITWVPVSPRRLRVRGYDQSFALARETAARLWLRPESMLRKVRHTPTQNRLTDAAARHVNVAGAFRAEPEAVLERRVLLIDDVLTSGATLSECARVLREAGAADVVCAVLARSRKLPEACM